MNITAIQQTYPPSPLKLGDDNHYVFLAKTALNVISANYHAIPVLSPVDNLYDENMELAVKAFQRIFDLPETGIIDKATGLKWAATCVSSQACGIVGTGCFGR